MKRQLPLVCRQWSAISTEFLYENLPLSPTRNRDGAKLLQMFQVAERGSYLARLVKRIDLDLDQYQLQNVYTLLPLLPSLRVMRSFRRDLLQPLPMWLDNVPLITHLSSVSLDPPMMGSLISANAGQADWRSLTIIMKYIEKLPKIYQPLSYLKYLTVTLSNYEKESDNALTALQSWMLPSLTHLSFHFYSSGHGTCVKDAVEIFGKQLVFLAFTGWNDPNWGTQFYGVLEAAPNLREIVISPHYSHRGGLNQEPSIKHINIRIVGFAVDSHESNWEKFSWYSSICREIFPSLSAFRITGVVPDPSRWYSNFWVRRAAIDLKDRGIRLEDRSGRDLWEELSESAQGEKDK
jgi:hypothetical protein